MKKQIGIVIVMMIIPISVLAQLLSCFNETGIGMFEDNNSLSNWTVRQNGAGTLELDGTDAFEGSQSIKAVVVADDASWHNRLWSTGCDFELKNESNYKVTFYTKSTTGGNIGFALRVGTVTYDLVNVDVVASSNWQKHEVVLVSEIDSFEGDLYINFREEGEYFLDNITVAEVDCNGDIGGSAAIDNCGYCAGGNTVVTPGSLCDLTSIAPDHSELRISGTLSQVVNPEGLELHRFTQDFYTNGQDGNWSMETARTQSGISVELQTNSPVINFLFSELDNSLQRTAHYAVFKNGELYEDYIDTDTVKILNLDQEMAVWKVTASVFRGVVFSGVELSNGYLPQPLLEEDTRPVYFAIGNSITHGNGQEHGGHLSYPYLLADSLGFHLHNLGIGGSKVTSEILRNIKDQQADYISVLWGYNDLYGGVAVDEAGGFYEKYEMLLDSLCVLQPQAKIYVIKQTPTNTVSTTNGTVDEIRTHQENTVLGLQSQCLNMKLVESHDYVTLQTDLADDVHLNVAGAENLAHGVITEVLDDGLITGSSEVIYKEGELYPNPTTGMLYLGERQEFELYDITGVLLFSGDDSVLDLSELLNGTYVLKTAGNSTRVIKQ